MLVMQLMSINLCRKDVVMVDLKKELYDLAEDIQYADMYDLTTVPGVLRKAVEKIEDLELENIALKEQIARNSSEVHRVSTSTDTLYLSTSIDRSLVKQQLTQLGVPFSLKDNTQRLLRKLQKAVKTGCVVCS